MKKVLSGTDEVLGVAVILVAIYLEELWNGYEFRLTVL